MQHEKDSVGTPLPENVWLQNGATQEQVNKVLTVNSFLLAAKAAMMNHKVVIYDPVEKMATITDQNGFTTFISH